MTVHLQVRDVRSAIYSASGGVRSAGTGAPSAALLGQVFHEVFGNLVGGDARLNFHAALDEAEPDLDEWKRGLVRHAYLNLVGPRLQQHHALLHHLTDQVLTFWDSIHELCDWLAELLWNLRLKGDEDLELAGSILLEERLVWELRESDWTDSVRMTGTADAIWRIPGNGQWCIIELKTGRTSPEADLAQACLYHQMLTASGEQIAGSLAVISFEPQKHERFYSTANLSNAQTSLKQLIARIAGVIVDAGRKVNSKKKTEKKSEGREIGSQLIDTLREYGVEISLDGAAIVGPAFIRFPISLGTRVKLRSVEQLSKEIQVRLKLDAPPRIGTEAGSVIIDLQRRDRQTVLFSEIRSQLPKADALTGCSQAPLGVDINGRLKLIDFARPEDAHLLVAGTTGSGKSEWLKSLIAGLIAANTPESLQLVLIDPKRNAFKFLSDSPFLFCPIVYPDERPAASVLEDLAQEMDRRYELLGEKGDDSIDSYSRRTGKKLPRIFCICDEYADLISGDKKTRKAIEQQIVRLGQKARAAGIHLIIATQYPSREIIKGVLDSNIPARVALRMQKPIESKMLLNHNGAETLLGNGDLLFKDVGEPVRLQGAWLGEFQV